MEGKMRSIYNALGRMVLIALFAVVLTIIPANKAYASGTATIGDYTYYLNDSTFKATVEGYVGAGGDISIPSTVEYDSKTYSVTGIGYQAFSGCTGLTSVNIPDGVTSIGQNAFLGCTGLTSVNIPDGVTGIGQQAFMYCAGLTSVNIPNGVTGIGNKAFSDCTGLTSVNIPGSVTSLDRNVFMNCTSLSNVTISYGISEITWSMFYNCSSLTDIEIPNSVTEIDNSAFFGCSSLTDIEIPNSVTIIGSDIFKNCSSLSELYYPAGLSINDAGLNQNANITNIISYATNTDDTITLTVENIADNTNALTLPSTYREKTVSAINCAPGVNKLTITSNIPPQTIHTDCLLSKVSDLSLPTNWVWDDADKNTALTADTPVTATAVYNGLDKAIYSNTEVEITITTTHTGNTTVQSAKAATCKEKGYTGDTYCLSCDKKISDGSEIAKLANHTFSMGVVTKEATVTENGVKTYACLICDETRTEVIPKLVAPSQEDPKEETEMIPEETPEETPSLEDTPEMQPEEIPDTDEESSTPVEPGEETEEIEDTSSDEEETTAPVVQPDSTDKELSKDKTDESDFNILFVIVPVVVLAGAGGIGFVFFKKKK